MQFCYTERLKGINYELWVGMGGTEKICLDTLTLQMSKNRTFLNSASSKPIG